MYMYYTCPLRNPQVIKVISPLIVSLLVLFGGAMSLLLGDMHSISKEKKKQNKQIRRVHCIHFVKFQVSLWLSTT